MTATGKMSEEKRKRQDTTAVKEAGDGSAQAGAASTGPAGGLEVDTKS